MLSAHVPPFWQGLGWQPSFVAHPAPPYPNGHVVVVVAAVDVPVLLDVVVEVDVVVRVLLEVDVAVTVVPTVL